MKKVLALFALATILPAAVLAQESAGLWGSGPDDVWALRSFGAVHFDGRAWSYQQFAAFGAVKDMDGSAASNIWAVAGGATDGRNIIYRYDGTRWDTVPAPATTHRLERIAVNRTNVFVLESGSERDTMAVHVWNGRAWTRERLPFAFVATGMQVVGAEVWIAGYAYFDPRPDTRNQFGVLVRRVAGRWVSNWTGRRSTDPIIGSATWTAFDAAGDRVLLYGEDREGNRRLLVRRGAAAWQRVAAPAEIPDGGYITDAFLLGNGTPVLRFQGRSRAGFLRQNGAAWEPFATAVTPGGFPDRPRVTWGVSSWSPAGTDFAYTLVDPYMVGKLTATDAKVMVAVWCLATPAPGGTAVYGAAGAGLCSAIAAGAGTSPSAAAPAAPGAKPGKGRAPPSGLPRPARP